MMPDLTLQALPFDPLFQRLDYVEQQKIRAEVAVKQFSQDSDFMKLPDDAKQRILQDILFLPPAFSNKRLETLVGKVGSSIKTNPTAPIPELGPIAKMLGRPTTTSEGPDPYHVWVTARDEVTNALSHATANESLLTASVYSNIQRKYSMKVPMEARMEVPKEYQSLARRFPEEEKKILQYYNMMVNEDSKARAITKFTQTTMPVLGMLMETLPMYGTLAGSYKVPKGLGKIAMAPFEKMMGMAPTNLARAGARLGGQTAHALVTSSLWFGREVLQDFLQNELPKNAGVQYFLKYGRQKFTEAFVWDFVVNMIEAFVWPQMKGIMKSFKPGMPYKGLFADLKVEQTSRLVSQVLGGGVIDPSVVASLPEKSQRFIKSVYNSRQVFDNVPVKSNDALLSAFATSQKWQVTPQEGGKYLLEEIMGEGQHVFDDLTSAQKFVDSLANVLSPPTEKTARDAILQGAAWDKVRLRKVISGVLSDTAYENVDILTKLIAPTQGRWTQGKVRGFAKASLKAVGADDSVVKSVTTREWGDVIEASVGKEVIATFPKVVATAESEVGSIRSFLQGIKRFSGGKFNIGEDLVQEYTSSLVKQNLFTPAWVEDRVKEVLKGDLRVVKGTKGVREFVLSLPNDTPVRFSSMDEVGMDVVSRTVEPEFYKSFLKEKFNYNLFSNETTGEVRVLTEKGKTIAQAGDFRSLVRENPMFLEKLPSSLGPQIAVASDDTLRVRYSQGVMVGPYHEVMRELHKFENYKPKSHFMKVFSSKEGSVQVHKVTKGIEVYLPDIEYRAPVQSIESGQKLIARGIEDWENLKFFSHNKGYRVTPFGDGFAFYSTVGDGKVVFAKTKVEAEKLLASVPIPSWAPELSGLDELDLERNQAVLQTQIPENMFKPTEFTFPTRVDGLPWHVVANQFWQPPEAWIVKAVEKGGDPNILKYFRQIESVRMFVKGQEDLSAQAIREIFSEGKGKKLMRKGRRVPVGTYFNTLQYDADGAARLFNKLDDGQKGVIERIRSQAYGETAESALAWKFQLHPQDFLEKYAPLIKKYYLTNPKKAYLSGKAHTLLKDVFDNAPPPRELDAFFRHARVSDVLSMAIEDDPLVTMLKYSSVGHRQTYFGPIWTEALDYVKKNSKNLDPRLKERFAVYLAQVMGLPEGAGQKIVEETLQKVFAKFGAKGALGHNAVSKLMSLNYLSFMGFRPWLPVRNSLQVWTTLAPRIGNDWTVRGLRAVAEDNAGEIYQFLRARGVLTGSLPLFGGEELTGGAQTLLGRAVEKGTHLGLQWYKNSDDFTRAVAWQGSYHKFLDSVERLNKGVWKNLPGEKATQRFLEMSGAVQLPFDLKEKVKFFMKNGKVETAAGMFADWMTEATLFAYRKGMSPMWSKGIVGKLFGMFGTYPAYYVQNVISAMKNMPRAQKLAFALRFVGNSTALYFLFKEGLGINAQNFLAWQPASFTGGPLFDMMIKALNSLDVKSYQGRQARAELFGLTTKDGKPTWKVMNSDVGRLVTGYQLRSVVEASKNFAEGDIYEGILNLGSFPINPDWQGE